MIEGSINNIESVFIHAEFCTLKFDKEQKRIVINYLIIRNTGIKKIAGMEGL